MFPELTDKPYEARLDILGLWSLEERCKRADLIEIFKIMKDFSNLNHDMFFDIDSTSCTRGHSLKIIKYGFSTQSRQSFSQRIINHWNSLDQETVNAATVIWT